MEACTPMRVESCMPFEACSRAVLCDFDRFCTCSRQSRRCCLIYVWLVCTQVLRIVGTYEEEHRGSKVSSSHTDTGATTSLSHSIESEFVWRDEESQMLQHEMTPVAAESPAASEALKWSSKGGILLSAEPDLFLTCRSYSTQGDEVVLATGQGLWVACHLSRDADVLRQVGIDLLSPVVRARLRVVSSATCLLAKLPD